MNKLTRLEKAKGAYAAFRLRAIAYLGGVCVKCGSANRLEFDHRDRRLKSFGIADRWSYSWDTVKAELDKCQLLCHEHHTEKSIEERGFKKAVGTHGTDSAYRHGKCRCEACRKAHNIYSAGYRKRRWPDGGRNPAIKLS